MRRAKSTYRGEPLQVSLILKLIEAHGDSDECLIWPFPPDKATGYCFVRFEGGKRKVHRVAFRLARPDQFIPALCVLHTCDVRNCFNPRHLYQGTYLDNHRDMIDRNRRAEFDGERNGRAKLTEENVREIRRRCNDGETQARMAAEFHVSDVLIGLIVRRLAWRNVA